MAKKYISDDVQEKLTPASSPQARENQCIALSYDLVEKRLREGTATSQETTHFLKLGTYKEYLEREKLVQEIELLKQKKKAIESGEHAEKLAKDAIEAMKRYGGITDEGDGFDDII